NCSSPSVGFFAPTNPLKKILIPFPVFSDVFNKFHEEQEQEFKTVVQYERNLAVKKEEMAEHSDNLRRLVDKKRSEMREIQEDISHMRAKLESLHEKMVPVFNTLLADDNQLNEYNVSSFAIAFAKKLNKDSG
ncbi:3620_t:CDS:2, partial [Paraglomus occultum]